MEKQEIEKLYNELGENGVNELYAYSCLLISGFSKNEAYNNLNLLYNLWLKDDENYSISRLSDMLYAVYDEINDEMSTREILQIMYEYEF